MAIPPQTIGNRYQIARALGQGAMATVFLCWDTRLQVWCAIKLMSDWARADRGLRRRFVREARLLARLPHTHIVRIFDVVDDVTTPYLVTEYLPGGSLLEASHPAGLHPFHAATVGAQMCAALGTVHANHIIHQDVKPANILLDAQGTPKLGDFGVSMLGRPTGVVDAPVYGTRAYMAPEHRAGQPDARSDLYALGATLYAVMRYENPALLLGPRRELAITHRVPPAMQALIRRATHPNPNDRFATAREMQAALEELAGRLGSSQLEPLRPALHPPPDAPPTEPIAGLDGQGLATTVADELPADLATEVPGDRLPAAVAESELREADLGRTVHRIEVERPEVEALLRGARALQSLRGRGAPQVLATGHGPHGRRWITMSAPRGETLDHVMQHSDPARRTHLLPLVLQACAIVGRAHAVHLSHGALSAAQVWIDGHHVDMVTGWGGHEGVRALGAPGRDERQADTLALAEMVRTATSQTPRWRTLGPIVAQARAGAFDTATALEQALRAALAHRGTGSPGRGRTATVGAAAVVAALAAAAWMAATWAPQPVAALGDGGAAGTHQEAVDAWWRTGLVWADTRSIGEADRVAFGADHLALRSGDEVCATDVLGNERWCRPCVGELAAGALGVACWDATGGTTLSWHGEPKLWPPLPTERWPCPVLDAIGWSPRCVAPGDGTVDDRGMMRGGDRVRIWRRGVPVDVLGAGQAAPWAADSEQVYRAGSDGRVSVVPLDGSPSAALRSGAPVIGLGIADGHLLVARDDHTLERWRIARPVQPLAHLAGLTTHRIEPDGTITLLDRRGPICRVDAGGPDCTARPTILEPCTEAVCPRWLDRRADPPRRLYADGTLLYGDRMVGDDVTAVAPRGNQSLIARGRSLELGPLRAAVDADVHAAAWAADQLLTGGQDGTLAVWTASLEPLAQVPLDGAIAHVGKLEDGSIYVVHADGRLVRVDPTLLALSIRGDP